ncbi:histidine kinase N-terminal 7TM domain-containing protein [Candidatus Margulisiibacteriota bacterium]
MPPVFSLAMYQPNIYSIPSAICGLFSLGMGIFVLLQNKRSAINHSFFILAFAVFIWQFGTAIKLLAIDPNVALVWGKFIYLGTPFIPAAVYYFVISFLGKEGQKKFALLSFLLAGFIFLPLIPTNLLLSGVKKFFWGYWFQAGPLHPLFIIYYLIFLGLSFALLYISYKKEDSGLQKIRIKYVMVAFLISYIGATDFIPDYGIEIYQPSHIPIMIYFAVIAYAIIKHRLMDITVVVRKSLLYSSIIGLFTGFYIFGIFMLSLFFQRITGYNSILMAAIVILVFALGFQPIKNRAQEYIDRIFLKLKGLILF